MTAAISVTISNSAGYQLAHAAGRGNNQTLDRALRTLFEQDNSIQSAMNNQAGMAIASNYTGTGSLITVANAGFFPKSVKIWNVTDKDSFWVWTQGQSTGTAVQQLTSTNGFVFQNKLGISSGITPTSTGFTCGGAASSLLSESGKVFYYEALRAGP